MSERNIFKNVVKLAPDKRAEYLNQACGGDQELRSKVEVLLRAHEGADDFIEVSPAAIATIERRLVEHPGLRVGRYRLLEQIGEGGMVRVWVAEQSKPVRRRGALTLINPGMDMRHVLTSFRAGQPYRVTIDEDRNADQL